MAKFVGFPKRIVLSVPRLFAFSAFVGVATVAGLQLTTQTPATQPITTQPVAQHKQAATVPLASKPTLPVVPQTTTPATTTPQTTAPKPATTASLPHSSTPAPVITPDPNASVNNLTPVNDTSPAAAPSSGDSGNAPSTPSQPPATTTGYTSTNWAGYIASGGSFTSVSGSWTIPQVSGKAGVTSADAAWIGIGGVGSSKLIQVGTQNTVDGAGHVTTTAFYEELPDYARTITTMHVSPGDQLNASITKLPSGLWHIAITDTTNGGSFTLDANYTTSQTTAEWIQEDPSYTSRRLVPFDTFGSINFTDGSATRDGNSVTLASANAQPVTLVSSKNQPLAVPSALGSDGQSFGVTQTSSGS